jgi:hypothetical protein
VAANDRPGYAWPVEDGQTGKDCGIGQFPSQTMAMSKAWFTAAVIAATLLARLRPITTLGDRWWATRPGEALC